MIPVEKQPEPPDFDEKVRKKGHEWLAREGISLDSPPPKASELPSYWSASNRQLWDAYNGTCAYLAIFFEWPTGAASTDHFIAKFRNAGAAYEWENYRLSCLGANRNKNKFDDVLDPIGLAPDTFILNLVTGRIRPRPKLEPKYAAAARKTIARLKLDSPENREMRARHFTQYLKHKHSDMLRFLSPFVWYEAHRQGLL